MVPQELFFAIGKIIKGWWWLLLPLLLWKFFAKLWLYWRNEVFASTINNILLEISIPKEVEKPLKAMENVFAGLWPLYDKPNWKEKWIKGQFLLSLSFEIVGINGEPHFFIRTPDFYRNTVESVIYSQYPDAEISEVPDYVNFVPQDVPNKEWDLWGTDMEMLKEDVYPIKTYSKFFEERPEIKEEKRIDPLASLLEGISKLKSGEQIWIQIKAKPVTSDYGGWLEKAKKIRDKLAGRKEKEKKSALREALKALIFGPPKKEEEERVERIPPEMMLTAGEKEQVSGIEDKIRKYVYESHIRFIYLAKRDKFFKPNVTIPLSFFTQFSTAHLNGLRPWSKTITKVTWFLVKRRLYLKKRHLFRMYKDRLPPLHPRPGGTYMLNIEELATLYHFPGRKVAPAPFMKRIEAKKGEAPPELPT